MIHRGDVVDADFAIGGRHPVVVVTRERDSGSQLRRGGARNPNGAWPSRRGVLGGRPGLDLSRASVANCDDIATLPKARLGRYRGRLDAEALAELDRALALAWASIAPRPELYRGGLLRPADQRGASTEPGSGNPGDNPLGVVPVVPFVLQRSRGLVTPVTTREKRSGLAGLYRSAASTSSSQAHPAGGASMESPTNTALRRRKAHASGAPVWTGTSALAFTIPAPPRLAGSGEGR